MRLEWEDYEGIKDNDDVCATGIGGRYYTVWKEVGQYVADVDDCNITCGDREYCIKACQDHEDGI